MPFRKKKVYTRFNVGTMMRQLKEVRERTALEQEKVGKASQSTKNSAKGYQRFTFFNRAVNSH